MDSNHRSLRQQIYSLPPLASREFPIMELVMGLEPQPADYKSAALPIELHQQLLRYAPALINECRSFNFAKQFG